jgi:hypothetical protein
LEKFAAHFSNSACGVTREKEAPYAGTGEKANIGFIYFEFIFLFLLASLSLFQ